MEHETRFELIGSIASATDRGRCPLPLAAYRLPRSRWQRVAILEFC